MQVEANNPYIKNTKQSLYQKYITIVQKPQCISIPKQKQVGIIDIFSLETWLLS